MPVGKFVNTDNGVVFTIDDAEMSIATVTPIVSDPGYEEFKEETEERLDELEKQAISLTDDPESIEVGQIAFLLDSNE